MVILGWVLDKPLPLLFDPFESIVRFHDLLTVFVFMIYARYCIYLVRVHRIGMRQGIANCHSPHHDQCCGRWKIQLVGRRNTHMSVFLSFFHLGSQQPLM